MQPTTNIRIEPNDKQLRPVYRDQSGGYVDDNGTQVRAAHVLHQLICEAIDAGQWQRAGQGFTNYAGRHYVTTPVIAPDGREFTLEHGLCGPGVFEVREDLARQIIERYF